MSGKVRLVVELAPDVGEKLGERVNAEGMNKTTIVNRAVQLYALIAETQAEGGKVFIQEAGSDELQRLRLL